MAYSVVRELIIENRHNGERLAMRRVKRGSRIDAPVVERRERASCARRLCAARSGFGPIASSDLRSPQRRLGRPASALLHGNGSPHPPTSVCDHLELQTLFDGAGLASTVRQTLAFSRSASTLHLRT